MDFAERAARNEEIFRDVNERIEKGVEQHGVASRVLYHCECANTSCFETLSLQPADYERIAAEPYRFVIVPGHETGEVEQVVERHEEYAVVEKIGEAREEIDREQQEGRS